MSPRRPRQFQCVAEQLAPVLDHLPAPTVQCRVHHHVRASGHQQVRTRRQPVAIDQVALHVEDRALFEARTHLVHADDTNVGAGVHGPCRKVLVEGQVRTPRLVDDQWLATLVADLGDAGQVGAGAVGTRADDQGARRVGMTIPRLPDLLG